MDDYPVWKALSIVSVCAGFLVLCVSLPYCIYHYSVHKLAMENGYEQVYDRDNGQTLWRKRCGGEKQ